MRRNDFFRFGEKLIRDPQVQKQIQNFFRQSSAAKLVGVVYGAASAVTFAVMGYDKQQAVRHQWRVPEKTLHTLELVGGWPAGSLAAQQVFRHKRSKPEYQQVYWSIVAAHTAGLGLLFLRKRIRFR
eukprot:TRINITY_DN4674_c0_g1_i1.p1 TRINITY_DN4674_c0_g1~~TRINITY_DN4674_c0_g1_i1.p1  ORF type:complete len:127 (-),score=15.17 TRINITY_DN4674_c0_g1_i1:111-491(-)